MNQLNTLKRNEIDGNVNLGKEVKSIIRGNITKWQGMWNKIKVDRPTKITIQVKKGKEEDRTHF